MARSALLIVNPIAGRGRARHVIEDVERGLRHRGLDTEVAVTGKAGDARAAASAAAGHDAVVAVGGDGTLNEVINGLDDGRPVALFPFGTGNVLAKELRLPRRVKRFCDMVVAGRLREVDLGQAAGRRFVSFTGVGFDAEVTAKIAEVRSGAIHISHYVKPVLRCLARYTFPAIEVRVDGGDAVTSRGFALVSNVGQYGGPLRVTPRAVHDDGLFDLCVLPRGSRLGGLRALLGFLLRSPAFLGGARYHRGRTFEVTAAEPVRYQLDGDAAGFLPTTIEVIDPKLHVIVP